MPCKQKKKKIKKRTWELKGGGKKQLKNRIGGKFHLRLVPFQRQLMGALCSNLVSPTAAQQVKRAAAATADACGKQGGDRGLVPQWPFLTSCGLLLHPWAPEFCPTWVKQDGSLSESQGWATGAGPCSAWAHPLPFQGKTQHSPEPAGQRVWNR